MSIDLSIWPLYREGSDTATTILVEDVRIGDIITSWKGEVVVRSTVKTPTMIYSKKRAFVVVPVDGGESFQTEEMSDRMKIIKVES